MLRGADELMRKLERLRRAVRDDAPDAALAGAEALADEWRQRVPVDEGHYRDSIAAERDDEGAVVLVGDVPGLPADEQPRLYAPGLEFGGQGRPAQPSLRPAVDAAGPKVAAAMADSIRDTIGRAD